MTQYELAHRSAVTVDRSMRGTLVVAGADRTAFLQGLLTNDISGLSPGRGCYAAWLTPQGRMITDMRVLALPDCILLDVRALDAPTLATRLEQLVFSEQVQVLDRTDQLEQVRVIGPHAPDIVADLLSAFSAEPTLPTARDLARWVEYQNGTFRRIQQGAPNVIGSGGSMDRAELLVVRDNELGVPGYDIYLSRQSTADSQQSVATDLAAARANGVDLSVESTGRLASGVSAAAVRHELDARQVPQLDHATAETLRVEAGRPLFGVDMDADTIPLEAGIEHRAISFAKGCYVGQEVIVRVTTRGHGRVARKLVGLSVNGTRMPVRGESLFAGDREIGRVTSATLSPAVGGPIALGYVHRDFAEPRTVVTLGRDSGDKAAVTELPFVPVPHAEGAAS